jgi:hypothetical protein
MRLASTPFVYRLPKFGPESSAQLVTQFLKGRGKLWEKRDLDSFILKPMCTTNPQYILSGCDEMIGKNPLESFEDEVLCLPHDLTNMHYLQIDKAVEKGGARLLLVLCALNAAWPHGLNEVTLMHMLGDESVLQELCTDPWPGGSVHHCVSLDAFFNSARTNVIEKVKSGSLAEHIKHKPGKGPITGMRRALSDGDVCFVDPSVEEDAGETRLLRAGELVGGSDMFAIPSFQPRSLASTSTSYLEFCGIVGLLKGRVGITDRSGVVNILHITFKQAVHDYCIQFDEEEARPGTPVPSPQKKMMRRQSSLERKYFSSDGNLLFKRNMKYFRNLVEAYQCTGTDITN